MGAVIGIIVILGLVYFAYRRAARVTFSRRYQWNRSDTPNLNRFVEPRNLPPQTPVVDRPEVGGESDHR